MGRFLKKYFWTILIVLSSLGLAVSAAYFSVSGLSKLFAGSAIQVVIMASFIEFAKIGTTAALHRYWKSMKSVGMRMLKYILTMMVVVVMAITSSGIYGFLADAYSATSTELEKISGQIELIEKKQGQKREKIVGINETKELKTTRIKGLMDLRVQQENRIDSLQKKGWYNSARRARKAIEQADVEIAKLGEEVDSLIAKADRVNEEIGQMDIDILNLQNSDVATEIGPLKYMSTVTGSPMENIINWFILALIFVFDPLAVLLIVFANVAYDRARETMGGNASPPEDKGGNKSIFSGLRERFEKKKESQGEVVESVEEESVEEVEEAPDEVENNDYKKVIDAVNNTDQAVFDFSYDFPAEEKGGEVVEYVEGEGGGFEKSETPAEKSIASIIKNIDSNPIYLKLIDILFANGKREVNDTIPPYPILVENIKNDGIEIDGQVIKNFLIICNLLGITNMSDKDNVKIIKDYKTSKNIISLVSK